MKTVGQGGAAGAGGEDNRRIGDAHVFGVDDFVGFAVLDDAVLMDAAGVREGVGAHNSLVGLHRHGHQVRHHGGGFGQQAGVDAGVEVEVRVLAQNHHHFFEGGVAGALAHAVYRAFNLPGPVHYAGNGVGGGQAQVVVAVRGKPHGVDARHVFVQKPDFGAVLFRQAVASGIGDVEDGGPGLDGRLADAGQEGIVGAAGIFGVKFHVFHKGLGQLDGRDGAGQHVLPSGAELVLNVNIRSANAGVNARVAGQAQGVGGHANVIFHGPRKAADGSVLGLGGDGLHGGKIAGAGHRKTGLNHINAEQLELPGNEKLLVLV